MSGATYEPFGEEWRKAMMQLPKSALVDMVRNKAREDCGEGGGTVGGMEGGSAREQLANSFRTVLLPVVAEGMPPGWGEPSEWEAQQADALFCEAAWMGIEAGDALAIMEAEARACEMRLAAFRAAARRLSPVAVEPSAEDGGAV